MQIYDSKALFMKIDFKQLNYIILCYLTILVYSIYILNPIFKIKSLSCGFIYFIKRFNVFCWFKIKILECFARMQRKINISVHL